MTFEWINGQHIGFFLMIIGLSGVQFGLKSWEWLTKLDDPEGGVRFVNRDNDERQHLRTQRFYNQFIINIILSEGFTKDIKLLSSNSYPFYDSGKNFGYRGLRCRCYWDLSCRCYDDPIEVWLFNLKCRFNCDSFTWLPDYNDRLSD